MQKYTYICWIHTDAIISKNKRRTQGRRRKISLSNIIPHIFICKFRKGCSKFACERELGTEHYWNILTPKLWPSALCLSRSPWLLNRSTGFPYYISSTTSTLLACLHWLVEPNWPELNCPLFNSSALYYLQTPTQWYGTRLRNVFRYLATGMCHFRILWNGLCDRHRAEITVIQFRGHSLPVRQSMRV